MPRLNILVMEDDAVIGTLLGELLVEMGHAVCAIEESQSGAIAAASEHHPNMLIADAMLGEDSGVETVDAILKVRSIPHIFVSGNISRVLGLRPSAIGLQKPYTEAQLASALTRAFDDHAASEINK